MPVSSSVSAVQSWSSDVCSSAVFGFADVPAITTMLGLGGFVPYHFSSFAGGIQLVRCGGRMRVRHICIRK